MHYSLLWPMNPPLYGKILIATSRPTKKKGALTARPVNPCQSTRARKLGPTGSGESATTRERGVVRLGDGSELEHVAPLLAVAASTAQASRPLLQYFTLQAKDLVIASHQPGKRSCSPLVG